MKLVADKDLLSAILQKVKEIPGALATNFFLDPEKLERCLSEERIFYDSAEGCVLLFRKSDSFYHVYYYATVLSGLASLIKNTLSNQQFVIDIITKENSSDNVLDIFKDAGFKTYSQLNRYTRINKEDSCYYQEATDVTFATEG